MKEESDRLGRKRADAIRGAMTLVWRAYVEHAWGHDEVGGGDDAPMILLFKWLGVYVFRENIYR